jgi:hypothetical protein
MAKSPLPLVVLGGRQTPNKKMPNKKTPNKDRANKRQINKRQISVWEMGVDLQAAPRPPAVNPFTRQDPPPSCKRNFVALTESVRC